MNAQEIQKQIEEDMHKAMKKKGYNSGHLNRKVQTGRRIKRSK